MEHRAIESLQNATAASVLPNLLSLPPLLYKNEPGQRHPIRDLDLPLLPNFFDHSGNICNGFLAAEISIIAGMALFRRRDQIPVTGIALAASAVATSVNYAYESGVSIPPFEAADSPRHDYVDAAYGAAAGFLLAATFWASLTRARKQRRGNG